MTRSAVVGAQSCTWLRCGWSVLTVALLIVPRLMHAAPDSAPHSAPDSASYAVIPKPTVLTPRSGTFVLASSTVIFADPALLSVARRFARDVANPTGFDLRVMTAGDSTSVPTGGQRIRLVRDNTSAAFGDEGYQLDVTNTDVIVRAKSAAGAFYALETLKQLFPAAIYRDAPIGNVLWQAAAVHIEDVPRFGWRGAHLDAARHFMPKEFVKKYIDLLARHKLNRFHWHLTEDQGWRIEILKYPRLTEVSSCRTQTLVGRNETDPAKQVFDGKPHCGFYTQDDVREIVAYATERFVTVVPEIEMPGHSQAAISAYPELSSMPDTNPGVMRLWGVSEFILNPDDRTIAFMQDVLTEVMALFPGPYIHVGGDEAVKTQWKQSPAVQRRIKALGLKDEHELQSWFIRQMDGFLTARGRRLVGWDEILEGGLAENATVMSWRGMDGGIAAAKSGHDVIMAPGTYTYFDHYQSADKKREPLAIGGFLPMDSVYAFEPVPPALTTAEAVHVLGAQAQLWTEYIQTPKDLEYMAFPRLVALSEVLWTGKDQRNFSDFMRRMSVHELRLQALDVNYRKTKPATMQ